MLHSGRILRIPGLQQLLRNDEIALLQNLNQNEDLLTTCLLRVWMLFQFCTQSAFESEMEFSFIILVTQQAARCDFLIVYANLLSLYLYIIISSCWLPRGCRRAQIASYRRTDCTVWHRLHVLCVFFLFIKKICYTEEKWWIMKKSNLPLDAFWMRFSAMASHRMWSCELRLRKRSTSCTHFLHTVRLQYIFILTDLMIWLSGWLDWESIS